MTVSTTRKLISCTVCEYRLLQLEIEHYSFLLEFVEFFDEMKTPEIKNNMELCHHKYHLSFSRFRLVRMETRVRGEILVWDEDAVRLVGSF